jgi:hypothetical protein
VGTINNFQLIPCFAARCFSFRQINLTLPKPKAADVSVQVFTCLPGSGPDGSCGESEAFIVRDLGASGADINLTIRATMGEVIWNVVANSNEGFEELKNLRFSTSAVDGRPGVVELPTIPDRPTNGPTEGDVIPEPSSMLLLGSGVLVFTQVLRRKLS